MHHRPKIEFNLLQLLLLLPLLHGIPAINQSGPQYNNHASNLDKTILHSTQIEETIEEVQKLLAQDPSLPRLTRGEIEELYEKVTREEYVKSVKAGELGRAKSMRALMLVLPYNTENNTEENLQELYTRPPITKVIDSYTPPKPIKFVTPDPNLTPKFENIPVGNLAATTYKPSSPIRPAEPSPTTYHPTSPPQLPQAEFKPFLPEVAMQLRPVTQLPLIYEYGAPEEFSSEQTPKLVHRFSSHYNAKTAEFLKLATQKRNKLTTSTVRPVADVLEGLGIVAQPYNHRRQAESNDYHSAESAPRPVVSNYAAVENLAPKIGPEAYANFKPLNIGEEIRVKPEIEDYLTRFGIVGGRKRKELKKTTEPAVESSEITITKIPPGAPKKTKKSVPGSSSGGLELEKLLSNLQELEHLNANSKNVKSSTSQKKAIPSVAVFSQISTAQPPMTPSLVRNGSPFLIEPKKSRRRIDPNLDINFASTSNQQSQHSATDEVQKLLANLQELEKLRGNPHKDVSPSATTMTQTETTPVLRTLGLTNRFSDLGIPHQLPQSQQKKPQTQQQHIVKKSPQQTDFEQMQRVLKQLEILDQLRSTVSSTTTTTRLPLTSNYNNNDLNQLRKLLNNDIALERLYEQVRGRPFSTAASQPRPTTTSTTTTTATTKKPPSPDLRDLQELQRYFLQLERARTRAPTPTPTTTTSTTSKTTTTTTTSTTPKTAPPPTIFQMPLISTQDLAQRIAANLARSRKQNLESEQLQELVKRVQELETQNNQRISNSAAVPIVATSAPLNPVTGFISRNVHQPLAVATANDYQIPSNDFAHLQQLYHQMQSVERKVFGRVEISTASTVAKPPTLNIKRTQELAQRLIDITNDTGYDDFNLRDVAPNDYVQLRKLLSKIKELERVKINANGQMVAQNARPRIQASATVAPQLLTAASIRTQSVQSMNGAEVPLETYQREEEEELQVQQPELQQQFLPLGSKTTTETPLSGLFQSQPTSMPLEATSTEGWSDLSVHEKPNKLYSGTDVERQLRNDNDNDSYLNMQPPLIQKTLVKVPAPSVETKNSYEEVKIKKPLHQPESEKLDNNAPDLKNKDKGLTKELPLEQLAESKAKDSIKQKMPEVETATTTTTNVIPINTNPPEDQQALRNSNLTENPTDALAKNSPEKIPEDINEVKTTEPGKISTSQENSSAELPPTQSTAVFSLTTSKSLLPKEMSTTTSSTESTVHVPIFSATKIIEAAIRRAANKIGVSTEQPSEEGLRRSDENADPLEQLLAGIGANKNNDLKGQASEMSYQLALPEASVRRLDTSVDTEAMPTSQNTSISNAKEKPTEEYLHDLAELQRFISNLQELQRLNLSSSADLLRKADAKYLESFKNEKDLNSSATKETPKTRRQSEVIVPTSFPEPTSSPSPSPLPTEVVFTKNTSTTTAPASDIEAPTRIFLGLKLGNASDGDYKTDMDTISDTTSMEDKSKTTTTEASPATEESRNGSLADLEDSFGPDPNKQSTTEPPKKNNGFYFLADWNSFLEVGQGDDQVVVRFNPKIGDPRLFIPVSVP